MDRRASWQGNFGQCPYPSPTVVASVKRTVQHAFEMALVQVQELVQTFATNAPEKAVARSVHRDYVAPSFARSRCCIKNCSPLHLSTPVPVRSVHRGLHDSHPDALYYAIKLTAEFVLAVSDAHVSAFTERSDLP